MRYDIEDLIEEIDEDIIEMSCEPEIFTSYENPNKEN